MKKTILFGLIIALMAIMSQVVFGAIACTSSADETIIIGNVILNATLTGTTVDPATNQTDYNATTPLLYGKCTDTGHGNTSYVLLVNATDGTAWTNGTDGSQGATLNVSWASTGFDDGTACTFYFVLSNITHGTNQLTCTATSAATIDNTAPAVPVLTYDDDSAGTTGNSFSSTSTILGVDDVVYGTIAPSNITTPCLLYFGSDPYSMTESTTQSSYTMLRGEPSDSTYDVKATCTDGTNTSTSTIYTDIEVDSVKEGTGTSTTGGVMVSVAEDAARKKRFTTYALIAVVAVVVWFVFIRKK